MVLVWPRKPPAGEGKRSVEGAVPMRRGDQRHPRCVGRRTFRVVLAVPRSSSLNAPLDACRSDIMLPLCYTATPHRYTRPRPGSLVWHVWLVSLDTTGM